MSKVPISVCIIAKNEERHIEECLKRLKPYGFEIVVTDTGSTDRTREIAEKYADKVLDFEWINDFSAARNFCAEHASNNWILALDCDEYVTDINIPELRQYMQKFPKHMGKIMIKNLLINTRGEKWYSTDSTYRFYNKNYYIFDRAIHEQIVKKNPEDRTDVNSCFVMPMELIHHGYALEPEIMRQKQERNMEILFKDLEKSPNDTYTLFQIGQSQGMLDNFEKAVEYYEKALKTEPNVEYMYVRVLIEGLCRAYLTLDKTQEAVSLMEKYANQIKTARLTFMHANAYAENGQTLKALMLYLKTVTLEDVDTLGSELVNCYGNIIKIYQAMGEDAMADMFKDKFLECYEDFERIKSV